MVSSAAAERNSFKIPELVPVPVWFVLNNLPAPVNDVLVVPDSMFTIIPVVNAVVPTIFKAFPVVKAATGI